MSKDRYLEVRSKLVLTNHSKDNFQGYRGDKDNRTDIQIYKIVNCILKGQLSFAGHLRMMKTFKGIVVIYKRDNDGNYVVITYYKTGSENNRNKCKSFS